MGKKGGKGKKLEKVDSEAMAAEDETGEGIYHRQYCKKTIPTQSKP